MESEFRIIDEYPAYEINREGVVRRMSDGFTPKSRINCNGWAVVSLSNGNGFLAVHVVKLVNGAFNAPDADDIVSLSILGYPNYSITYDGRIWSHKSNKYLAYRKIGRGYLGVSIVNSSGSKHFLVHRLMALMFIPNPLNKETVNHIDGNKENNCITNLEWNTYEENNNHAIYNNMRFSILDTEMVHEICEYLHDHIGCTVQSVCDKLGVSWDQVGDIRKRETWKGISKDYEW